LNDREGEPAQYPGAALGPFLVFDPVGPVRIDQQQVPAQRITGQSPTIRHMNSG
jgi:hypothetical protein